MPAGTRSWMGSRHVLARAGGPVQSVARSRCHRDVRVEFRSQPVWRFRFATDCDHGYAAQRAGQKRARRAESVDDPHADDPVGPRFQETSDRSCSSSQLRYRAYGSCTGTGESARFDEWPRNRGSIRDAFEGRAKGSSAIRDGSHGILLRVDPAFGHRSSELCRSRPALPVTMLVS